MAVEGETVVGPRNLRRKCRIGAVVVVALASVSTLTGCAMPGRKAAVKPPAATRLQVAGALLHVDLVANVMPTKLPHLAAGHAVAVVWSAPAAGALTPSSSTSHGFSSVDVGQPLALAWLLHGRVVRTAVADRCKVSCPAYDGPVASDALVISSGPALALHAAAVFS